MSDIVTRIPAETFTILSELARERARQDRKHGNTLTGKQDHDFGSWLEIFMEELGEASRERMEMRYRGADRGEQFREELMQATATLVATIECGDRNGWFE